MKSSATANPVLQVTAVKYLQDTAGFVATKLFPRFSAGLQSASYYVFNKENMLNVPLNIQRAPSAPFSRSQMVLSDDTFNCRDYGHEEPVDDRERKKYASSLDSDNAAIRRCTNVILINQEKRVFTKATSASVPTATPSYKWDNYSDSNPIYDVDVGKNAVRLACGLFVNMMTFSYPTFLVLKEHPKIIDKIKYSQRGVVTAEILAEVFGVDQIAIAGATINTAAEGQTVTPADIWSDNVVLSHVETAMDLMAPNFGRCFQWDGIVGPDGVIVQSYREDKIDSDVHRVRQDQDEKLVGPECGYNISDVCASF